MASLRCCYSPNAIIIPRRICSKTMIRACMQNSGNSESKKPSNSVSFCNKFHKVYEDKNMGILCYTDENGELVCEGLDEGPRLTREDMENLSKERELNADEARGRSCCFGLPGRIGAASKLLLAKGKN